MTSPYYGSGAGGWFAGQGGTAQASQERPYTNGNGQPAYYGNGGSSTTNPSSHRFYATHGGPVTLPGDWSEGDAQQWVAAYNDYIDRLTAQMQQTQGVERDQIYAQIEDAKKARENALTIADIEHKDRIYGIDQTRQQQKDDLIEKQREFNASHGVEMARLGLDRAKTATDYLSTPDRFVQAGDFLNLSGRIVARQSGAGTGSGLTPQQKTMSDYANVESGGTSDRQISSGSSGTAATAVAGQGSGSDARVKALRAVIDAAPPSDSYGMDQNSYHVLNAAKAIYSLGNLTPDQQATIGSNKQYQQMLGSGLSRAGVNADNWWQKQQQNLVGQGSARSGY